MEDCVEDRGEPRGEAKGELRRELRREEAEPGGEGLLEEELGFWGRERGREGNRAPARPFPTLWDARELICGHGEARGRSKKGGQALLIT